MVIDRVCLSRWLILRVTVLAGGMVLIQRRFLNMLLILEMLTLVCIQIFVARYNLHSLVFILVLGVAEAAVGLSLLVWLSRSRGTTICVFFSKRSGSIFCVSLVFTYCMLCRGYVVRQGRFKMGVQSYPLTNGLCFVHEVEYRVIFLFLVL